ncbi:MAG: hypothetical protein PF489_01880, partial [Salinivirgaceae bacterium]|nr:hypothetical protein [Salinivirgaceae bacterium]
MNQEAILISFIVAILGIAYPILLQVITRLDEKYNSTIILDLIKSEKEWKIFKLTLFSALIITGIHLLKRPLIYDFGIFNTLISHSGIILLYVSTGLLITSYIFFVHKTIIYYHPQELVKYLIEKSKHNNTTENKPIQGLTDILMLAIKTADAKIARELTKFFTSYFSNKRDELANSENPYWDKTYIQIIRRGTEELLNQKSKRVSYLNRNIVGGLWLLGTEKGNKIPEETYQILWENLINSIEYDRPDFVMKIWQNSHDYYRNNFYEFQNDNVDLEERNRFLEFHYAMGGLLLFSKKYKLINSIFNYITNLPPKYFLLPDTFNEIFYFLIRFREPEYYNNTFIGVRYQYSGSQGLDSEFLIKKHTQLYLGLLFIRQYSLHKYYTFEAPLAEPSIPPEQKDKKLLIEYIPQLKNFINEIMNDKELIISLEWEKLITYLNEDSNDKSPSKLINNYIQKLEQSLEETEIT